ncbi:hypothetical protein RND71_038482 [Anisodus tanguticus]|uniref:Uncharacterized protein n=1 Tax=Anisodus tanguticus TaxID=243964 RepID=A0AAE1R050_9SOLA|nr:hypothetical protein RND71_038482 [Anisodus tanguticus]
MRTLVDEGSEDEVMHTQEDVQSSAPQVSQQKAETRFQSRQNVQVATGTRKINFIGNETGVSEPTDLPYSPTELTWKENAAVTRNQLEKLRTRKGKGISI